jgi:hypothetical protein
MGADFGTYAFAGVREGSSASSTVELPQLRVDSNKCGKYFVRSGFVPGTDAEMIPEAYSTNAQTIPR